MARFCTKCGTSVADGALFCDNCGSPIRKSAATATAAAVSTSAEMTSAVASMPRISRRALAIGGAAAAILIAAAGSIGWWMAPETASEASFARAVNEYYATNAAASERLLCLNDLPYGTDPIRVGEYDSRTRKWMDTLSRAGAYTAPTAETVGQFIPLTRFVYQLTEDGKKSVRNNKLCLGSKIAITNVKGFDRVQTVDGKPVAQASAILGVADEAPWLAKSQDRSDILQKTDRLGAAVELPLAIVEGKWTVTHATPPAAGHWPRSWRGSGIEQAAPPAEAGGILGSIRNLFSFAKKNPLIGKWRDESGIVSMEFTDDGIVQNGIVVKASYDVKDDQITLKPEGAGGAGMLFKLRDSNTLSMDMGLVAVTLRRVN